MTTVINNPGGENRGSNAVSMVVAIIVLIVVVVLFFVYVLPRIRNNNAAPANGTNINVTIPAGTTDNSGSNY